MAIELPATELIPPAAHRRPIAALTQKAVDWTSYLVLMSGAAMTCFMAYIVWVSYTPMFWVDQWSFLMELIGNHGHYSAAMVWRQHDDHRIPLPKLFYLIDLYVFHGKNIFLLVVIFCVQLANVAWLSYVYFRLGKLSGAVWRTAVGLTGICLFGFRQVENFLFGSDLPLVIPCLGATVAIASLGVYRESQKEDAPGQRGSRWLVVSWSAAGLSSLSLTNGLLIWPILVVLGLIWRLSKRVLVGTAALAGSLIALWAIGYSNHVASMSLSTLALVARYVQILYGSSWSFISDSLGMWLAAVVLPVAVIAAVWFLLKRPRDTFGVVLISVAGFMLGSSVATALGRIRFGVEYGRAERYQTGALLFWCLLAVLVLRQIAKKRNKGAWMLAAQASIVAIFVTATTLAGRCIDNVRIHQQQMKRAAVAMEAGVNDAPWLLYPIVRPWMSDDMLHFADFLREHKWSIFADEQEYPLGRQFTRFYRVVSPKMCRGTIDQVVPISDFRWPGFRVAGWTWDLKARAPGKAIAWVDLAGRLIGAAQSGFSRPDVRSAIPAIDRSDTGYIGYIPGDLESAAANAYVILADGFSACPLSGAPLNFDVHATASSGPPPTGETLNLVRHNFIPSAVVEMLNGKWVAGASQLKAQFGQPLVLGAWVTDPAGHAGSAADIAIDGLPFTTTYGLDRPDIAKFLRAPAAAHCGLQATVPGGVSRGKHKLTLRVVSSDQELYYESLPITLTIQ